MDSLITAAARALEAGDPLAALNRVALRDDAPALALRGIAMAQLGELARARELLRQAARGFGERAALARARCQVAEAEIALATRDLGWADETLQAARQILQRHGDWANAAVAALVEARRLLLCGRLEAAEAQLKTLEARMIPPALVAVSELTSAGIALRRWRAEPACMAIDNAAKAAREARIPVLVAEVEQARAMLERPMARLIARGSARAILLDEAERVLASEALVIDGFRHAVRAAGAVISLAGRPVLFALARTLAERWPADASRAELLTAAFRAKQVDESHRARLRMEMSRLRAELASVAEIEATDAGFRLVPHEWREPVVLVRPDEEKHAEVLALLSDGELWASSTLALALGTSGRTVQRALEELGRAGKAQAYGRGRVRRWAIAGAPAFATGLLLQRPLPAG